MSNWMPGTPFLSKPKKCVRWAGQVGPTKFTGTGSKFVTNGNTSQSVDLIKIISNSTAQNWRAQVYRPGRISQPNLAGGLRAACLRWQANGLGQFQNIFRRRHAGSLSGYRRSPVTWTRSWVSDLIPLDSPIPSFAFICAGTSLVIDGRPKWLHHAVAGGIRSCRCREGRELILSRTPEWTTTHPWPWTGWRWLIAQVKRELNKWATTASSRAKRIITLPVLLPWTFDHRCHLEQMLHLGTGTYKQQCVLCFTAWGMTPVISILW